MNDFAKNIHLAYQDPKTSTSNSTEKTLEVKCVIVGDGNCGKTCMGLTYINNVFPGEYVPTIFNQISCTVMCQDKIVNLNICDTAGKEQYDRLRPLSYLYPITDVFLMVFAVNNVTSLQNITTLWKQEITEHCPEAALILVGAKSDLRKKFENSATNENRIFRHTIVIESYLREICGKSKTNEIVSNLLEISKFPKDIIGVILKYSKYDEIPSLKQFTKVENAKKIAEGIGAYAYIECSAKNKQNLEVVFKTAVKACLEKRLKKKSKRKCLIM